MKTIITTIILSMFLVPMIGQNCDNYEDCLAKGKVEKSAENAIEFFSKAIKHTNKENVNPSTAYLWRGMKYYGLSKGPESIKENENAETDFLEALKNDPDNYNIVEWLAILYQIKAKNYVKGVAFMDSQIALKPNNAMAYYSRGNINRFYKKYDLALADFKKAYEIMEAGTQSQEISKTSQGYIPTFYALLKLKNENKSVHNEETLAILEKANKLVPNNEQILSEMSLAYLDNGESSKAFETAHKALELQEFKGHTEASKTKIPGAQAVLAYETYTKGNYEEAAFRSSAASDENQRIYRHPAIVFYAAIIQYDRYTRIYPDKWEVQVAGITRRLEEAATLADGTVYQFMADDAKKYLDAIKFPYGKPENDPNYELDFKEFLVNFQNLPSSYSFTSQTIKGYDITNIPFVKKWLRLEGELTAIGQIKKCGENHIMVVALRDGQRTDFRFMKIGPKGEYLGWKGISSFQLYSGKAQNTMEINISVKGNELIVKEKNTYLSTGKSHGDERKVNCAEEWKI